jgi:hypothetical protein
MRAVIGGLMVFALAAPAQAATSGPQLAGMVAAESNAYDVWSLRAGLNVAAIQCQFSGYLRTVPTYNGLLRQHNKEFADSNAALLRYFTRTKGAKAAVLEQDRFNTRLWQSFSSIDAQLAFCEAAGAVGRDVLATPVGKLGAAAGPLLERLRLAFAKANADPLTTMVSVSVPVMSWSVADVKPCPARDAQRGRC